MRSETSNRIAAAEAGARHGLSRLTAAAAAVVIATAIYLAAFHFYGRDALSGFKEARHLGMSIRWQWKVIEGFFAPADMVDETIRRAQARKTFGGAWNVVDNTGRIAGRIEIDDALRADIEMKLSTIGLDETIDLEMVRPEVSLTGMSGSGTTVFWLRENAAGDVEILLRDRQTLSQLTMQPIK